MAVGWCSRTKFIHISTTKTGEKLGQKWNSMMDLILSHEKWRAKINEKKILGLLRSVQFAPSFCIKYNKHLISKKFSIWHAVYASNDIWGKCETHDSLKGHIFVLAKFITLTSAGRALKSNNIIFRIVFELNFRPYFFRLAFFVSGLVFFSRKNGRHCIFEWIFFRHTKPR